MKHCYVFLLIILSSTTSYCQFGKVRTDEALLASTQTLPLSPVFLRVPPQTEARRKPGEILRNVGQGLTFGGIAFMGIGIAVLSSSGGNASATIGNDNLTPAQQRTIVGTVFGVQGLALTITGIVLWSKGVHKMHAAENQPLSFDIKGTRGVVRYRF